MTRLCFHMVRDVETEMERKGGELKRVVLDDEMKADAFEQLYRLREEQGETSVAAHHEVAAAQDLHVEDGHFVFPDVRLELLDANGEAQTVDLELVTQHYRAGHLSGKSHAGFRMFRAGGASARGGTPWSPREYLP